MIDAKGIIHELNQPTWKTEVKQKRTNRDKFLEECWNRRLAILINSHAKRAGYCAGCPHDVLGKICYIDPEDDIACIEAIEKWLGEEVKLT